MARDFPTSKTNQNPLWMRVPACFVSLNEALGLEILANLSQGYYLSSLHLNGFMDLLEIKKLGLEPGDKVIVETYPDGMEVRAELIFRSDLTLYCKKGEDILNIPFSTISRLRKIEAAEKQPVGV